MNKWNWVGARWWKFDFHAHTPASDDYGKGPDQESLKSLEPRDWLLDYMEAEIDCVAVTDHNSGRWIDVLKKELYLMETNSVEGFRPLYIFPGVEISVHGGIHLLAILGCDKETSDIYSLLGKVNFEGDPGATSSVTSLSFTDVVEKINSVGGIAIPAHVDKKKGLFYRPDATTLKKVLTDPRIFAMELVDPDYEMPQIYNEGRTDWTVVVGSDSHHPLESSPSNSVGNRFTWVKMGTPSLEGLRLALLDGNPMSVMRSDAIHEDPNAHAQNILESVEVSNARYFGRSAPFLAGFNPWMNSIIGGRGTGKSTLIELLRIVLRRTDEIPEDLRDDFEKYKQVYSSRKEGGLLTARTKIKIIYRKDNTRFRVQWDSDGCIEPIAEEVAEGKWKPTVGEISQRFPARIYSQKQIFDLAKRPLALLTIIDEAPEVNRRSWDEKWNLAESKFLSLCAKSRELIAGFSEESRLKGDLEDVKRRLKIFEDEGYADVLKNFQILKRQDRNVEDWEESWTKTGEKLRKVAEEIVPNSLEDFILSSDSHIDTELQSHITTAHQQLAELSNQVRSLADQADSVLYEWKQKKDSSLWKESIISAEQAYQSIHDNLDKEGLSLTHGYGELVQRRQVIEDKLDQLIANGKQVAELDKQIDQQIRDMILLRKELTQSRSDFLKSILDDNQYVKIKVIPYGAKDVAEQEFRQLLQKEKPIFSKDIGVPGLEGLLGNLYPEEDISDESTEERLTQLKRIIRDLSKGNKDNIVVGQKFASHVSHLNPEVIDRIEAWFPEDSLDVQYNATGEGDRFLSIDEGSPGQRTAALLAFLLSYGDEPLILDQPEDDLDNLLIYDLIVTQLRSMKRHRQIIVVTHNANIVVNGDSEMILALAPCHGESIKNCYGSLQDQNVRERICSIMEGGSRAFEDRYRRIQLKAHHVQ